MWVNSACKSTDMVYTFRRPLYQENQKAQTRHGPLGGIHGGGVLTEEIPVAVIKTSAEG